MPTAELELPTPVADALPDSSVRAIVIDAHAPSRIGLAALLDEQPWIERCLLAADSSESVTLTRRHRPDVAILDISQAGPFAASITAAIRGAHPGVQILLISRCRTTLGGAAGERRCGRLPPRRRLRRGHRRRGPRRHPLRRPARARDRLARRRPRAQRSRAGDPRPARHRRDQPRDRRPTPRRPRQRQEDAPPGSTASSASATAPRPRSARRRSSPASTRVDSSDVEPERGHHC